MLGGGKRELKLHLAVCAKVRGVGKQFGCIFATEVSRADSECTQGSDWARPIYTKALCRGRLHFNTTPVKKEGKKKGLNI